jgi:pimeloyl-ACP methyl ester carboxylesterase
MELGRAHRLEIDGVRVNAVDWHPARDAVDAPPVLLVHGLGANTVSWLPFGQLLADRLGTTVTAIDLIGFGRTRAPDRPATLATNRELVEAVLDERGDATIVVGNSMGGLIGAGVAARRPDLVAALVLVDPALPWGRVGPAVAWRLARLTPLMAPSVGRRAVSARARLIGPARLVDLTLDLCIADRSRLDPLLRQRLVLLAAERYAYPEAAAGYADAARSLFRELGNGAADRHFAAASARCPTLLVHGELDRLVPVGLAREATDRHRTIDLDVLVGVGHAPQMEVPDQLVEVVATWLDARMGPWETQAGRPAMASASSPSLSGLSSTS